MRCHHPAPLPPGAEGAFECPLPVSRPRAGNVADLRPVRAVLSRDDYWQLNQHRRRCEELGGSRFTRLAWLIRAKLLEAWISEPENLSADVVTGTSRATFAIDHRHPETRLLYHWDYPGHERRPLRVASFLGVALIGMAVGQRRHFIDGQGDAGEVLVLGVDTQGTPCANPFD